MHFFKENDVCYPYNIFFYKKIKITSSYIWRNSEYKWQECTLASLDSKLRYFVEEISAITLIECYKSTAVVIMGGYLGK